MKKNMFYIILVGLISILGLSYSIFIIDSRKVTTSELLVGNLTYGINIYEDNSYTPISGTEVTIPANTSKEYYITVFSTNPVSSKFTLAYNNSNVTVEVSSRSGWNPSGLINEYSSNAFSKTIKIKVTNNTNSSQTVDFQAYGGYSFNSVASINLGNGYYSVINTYNEAFTLEGELLTDIVKDDTNCIPTASEPCLYGGDTTVNYFKFDEDSNDVYRVIGNYLVNGEVLTKIIGPASTDDNINSTTTLSSADYQKIGGSSSYLGSNYASLSVYYLNSDVAVTGNGTSSSKYILSHADIYFISYQYVGSGAGESSYDDYIAGLGTDYVATLNCSEGTTGVMEDDGTVTFSEVAVPATCRVVFYDLTLVNKILIDNDAIIEANVPQRLASNNDFDSIYAGADNTFFKTNNAEHGDTVYYFAGANASVNNWVIFGTCKSSTYNCTPGRDLYWRIIRTNEESTGGGVRLLYAGSGLKEENGKKLIADNVTNAYIKTSAFNSYSGASSSNRPDRYAGYMYGTSGYNISNIRENTESSAIKGVIDVWYTTTFTESNLKSKISTTAIYCNDRSYTNDSWDSSGSSTNSFGSYGRVYSSKAPSYACGINSSGYSGSNYFNGSTTETDRVKDRFSSDGIDEGYSLGNGLLKDANGNKVPAALMTADEVVFAGGSVIANNNSVWYYSNTAGNSITYSNMWWTISPANSSSTGGSHFYAGGSYSAGKLSTGGTSGSNAVRPVISLNSDTLWLRGNGTPDDPYRIVED